MLKPDMAHLETWPEFFRPGETMLVHRWDLSDLEEVIDRALAEYPRIARVAETGQEIYRRFTSGPDAAKLFCDHVAALLQPGPR